VDGDLLEQLLRLDDVEQRAVLGAKMDAASVTTALALVNRWCGAR
jgi:hypothetical protein